MEKVILCIPATSTLETGENIQILGVSQSDSLGQKGAASIVRPYLEEMRLVATEECIVASANMSALTFMCKHHTHTHDFHIS